MLHIANSVNLLSLSLSLSLSQRSQIFCLFNTELEDKFKYSFTFGEFLKAFANFRNFKDLEYADAIFLYFNNCKDLACAET